MKKKQNKEQKQKREVLDKVSRSLLAIEEACSVLNDEFGIYTTELDEAFNAYYRDLDSDEEKEACRAWCEQNGFDVSAFGDDEF